MNSHFAKIAGYTVTRNIDRMPSYLSLVSQLAVFDEYTRHRLFVATRFKYATHIFEEIATANWLTRYRYESTGVARGWR